MNAAELTVAMLDAKRELDEAHEEHRRCAIAAAVADRAFRLAKATAVLASSGTVQQRDAHMEQATADLRYEAKLADDLLTSALEAIRSRRQVISALQSLAAAQREEAHLARYMDRELDSA